eukprot:211604-Rhodomonas_salina.2
MPVEGREQDQQRDVERGHDHHPDVLPAGPALHRRTRIEISVSVRVARAGEDLEALDALHSHRHAVTTFPLSHRLQHLHNHVRT